MTVEIVPAERFIHDTLLRNLYQFYLYEFSRFMPDWRVTAGGRFIEEDLDGCWTEEGRRVFLIQADGEVAGFALVDIGRKSYFTDEPRVNFVAEFFVMAACQQRGIGARAALALFDRFPGRWEVSEVPENVNAQAFWRKIIGRYTSGNYREIVTPERQIVVQLFDNSSVVA